MHTGKHATKTRAMVLVKLLDGQTMQLVAEQNTVGQELLDQVCTMLKAYETYYFGLMFFDSKVRLLLPMWPMVTNNYPFPSPLFFHRARKTTSI